MNHPHRSKLFDCSPAIAAKLARCNAIATVQCAVTRKFPLGHDLTAEDTEIMENRLNWSHADLNTRYLLTLNL